MTNTIDWSELAKPPESKPVTPVVMKKKSPPSFELPSVEDIAKMSYEEWQRDWKDRIIKEYGWNVFQDLSADVTRLLERWEGNTSRKHTVDLTNRERPEVTYVIKGLVPANVPVWLWGLWSAGKTIAGIDLACHLAMGKPWMGHEVVRSKVLFIQVEDSDVMMFNRLDAWQSANGELDLNNFSLQVDPNFVFTGTAEERLDNGQGGETLHEYRIGQTKSVHDLIEHLKEDHFDVVIIDNLASAMPSSNMSDPEVKAVIDACHQIVNEAGVTLFVVAHSNAKDDSIAGLTVLQNLFNTALHVRKRGERRTIDLTKSKTLNLSKVKPMAFDIVDSDVVVDGEYVGVVRFSGQDDDTERLIMQAVYALSDDLPVTKQAIEDQIRSSGKKVDRNRLRKVINDLASEGTKIVMAGAKVGLPD